MHKKSAHVDIDGFNLKHRPSILLVVLVSQPEPNDTYIVNCKCDGSCSVLWHELGMYLEVKKNSFRYIEQYLREGFSSMKWKDVSSCCRNWNCYLLKATNDKLFPWNENLFFLLKEILFCVVMVTAEFSDGKNNFKISWMCVQSFLFNMWIKNISKFSIILMNFIITW